jgi:aryl-alcohol dehydrogenase-like predicted oxidoreductase
LASWQLAHANLLAEVRGRSRFVVLQGHYHMLEREIEREMLPFCRSFDVGVVPYFPLAGGFLTGKYRQGEPAPAGSRGEDNRYVQGYMTGPNFDRIRKLEDRAKERDRGLNELAQAWLLSQPSVCSVITGATKVEQVQANARASDWVLGEEDLGVVSQILG